MEYTYGTFSLTEAPENLFGDHERNIYRALKEHFEKGLVSYKANKYIAELIVGCVPVGIYSFVEGKLRWK